MKTIPPYYHNFDNSHCLQCSLRSALEYFNPKKKWTWAQLDKLSNKRPGIGTWHMSFLSALDKLGYEGVCIENFNLQAFVADPDAYFKKSMTKEHYEYAMKNTHFESEIKASKTLLETEKNGNVKLLYRNHTAADIRKYLKEGYCIIHQVNHNKLYHEEGYCGHFILLYKLIGRDIVVCHDNGGLYKGKPMGMPNMRFEIQHVLKAGTSGKTTGGFYAIRPKQ